MAKLLRLFRVPLTRKANAARRPAIRPEQGQPHEGMETFLREHRLRFDWLFSKSPCAGDRHRKTASGVSGHDGHLSESMKSSAFIQRRGGRTSAGRYRSGPSPYALNEARERS